MHCLNVHSFLLCMFFVHAVLCTDLGVVYKHNIYYLKDADSSYGTAHGLLSEPLHCPSSLAYSTTNKSGDTIQRMLLVGDSCNGQASVFRFHLNLEANVTDVDLVLKPSSLRPRQLQYDSDTSQLYLSSADMPYSVLVSQLPANLGAHWAPEPTPVSHEGVTDEARIYRITMNECNRVLYWSEQDNNKKSRVQQLPLDGSGHSTLLLEDTPDEDVYYQAIHFDHHSHSLIVAVTNTSDYVANETSCSFIAVPVTYSVGHLAMNISILLSEQLNQHVNSVKTTPSSHMDGNGYRVIVSHIENCFPYSIASDEHFLYYSDWAQEGLMRLSKTGSEDVQKLVNTPAWASHGASYHGAYGVVTLGGQGVCHVMSETSTAIAEVNTAAGITAVNKEHNMITDLSSMGSIAFPNEFLSGPHYTINLETESSMELSTKDTNFSIKTSQSDDINNEGEGVIHDADEAMDLTPLYRAHSYASPQGTSSYPEQSSTSETDKLNEDYRNALQQPVLDGEGRQQLEEMPFCWFSGYSRFDLIRMVLILLPVCALLSITMLCCVLYRTRCRVAACKPHPDNDHRVFVNDELYRRYSSEYSAAVSNGGSDHSGTKAHLQQKVLCQRLPDGVDTNSCNNSSTDVYIDLTGGADKKKIEFASACADTFQSNKCTKINIGNESSDTWNSISSSFSARHKKKTFGPRKGSIKHLISKSFSSVKVPDGVQCPGIFSDDGVLINIEDCCQMTLCDTPCYTSVQREGREYLGPTEGEDNRRLLDEYNHTGC